MARHVIVPEGISIAIGELGLPRPLVIALENILHTGTPLADTSRRWAEDDQCFSFQVVVERAGEPHYFVIVVNDTTSPDHFIIDRIGYASFGEM